MPLRVGRRFANSIDRSTIFQNVERMVGLNDQSRVPCSRWCEHASRKTLTTLATHFLSSCIPNLTLHNRTGEDNADAHHKRQIMGREVIVAITDGKLHLGPWEHIFYYEFDGRRRKRVLVKMIGE